MLRRFLELKDGMVLSEISSSHLFLPEIELQLALDLDESLGLVEMSVLTLGRVITT